MKAGSAPVKVALRAHVLALVESGRVKEVAQRRVALVEPLPLICTACRTKLREGLKRRMAAARLARVRSDALAKQAQKEEERRLHRAADAKTRADAAFSVPPREKNFECPKCGRWAERAAAADRFLALAEKSLGVPGQTIGQWRISPVDVRPATLQRDFGLSYEEAVIRLDRAVRLGILAKRRTGLIPAPALCVLCYEGLEATVDQPREQPSSTRDSIPPQLRFRVLKRDGFRCQYCGRMAPEVILHLDHVIPVAAGGETSEGNLVTSCDTCNTGKSSDPVL